MTFLVGSCFLALCVNEPSQCWQAGVCCFILGLKLGEVWSEPLGCQKTSEVSCAGKVELPFLCAGKVELLLEGLSFLFS